MVRFRSQYDTKAWGRRVYEAFGFGQWEFKQLPDELKVWGMPKRAHNIRRIHQNSIFLFSSFTEIKNTMDK
jgi:hypothetical protein